MDRDGADLAPPPPPLPVRFTFVAHEVVMEGL